ncbi:MAG: urease accessory protein UreF [Gammaproteobacteria bacterium]|nr:urease accessory protein UreF [Gammaproteobacteria bacterium]MBQ0839637.1 urease accessory protein UreF [Gammaproteobacteria bacterium]
MKLEGKSSDVKNVDNVSLDNATMLFQLLRFSSPSLPIGSFAWSQGLESAIELEWLKNTDDLYDWLLAMLEHAFVQQELPLLIRMLSSNEEGELECWNQRSLAMRESAELRMEDVHTGRALLQLARSLDVNLAKGWRDDVDIGYLAAFTMMCRHYQLGFVAAATGFIWSWLDNQIAAAIKLFPLGQTAGQLLIERLAPAISGVIEDAQKVQDRDIGISLPGQVMASMLHESQYSRMFRS